MQVLEKLKEFSKKLAEKGIPIPFVQDPLTGKPSVSLTLVLISGFIIIIGLFLGLKTLVKGIDVENSLEFFLICAGLYFGRSLSKKINGDGK